MNQVANFERVIAVLKTISVTPVATTSELHEKALNGISLRSAQRYLKALERSGYITRKDTNGWFNEDSRFFLTEKAKQLFGVSL